MSILLETNNLSKIFGSQRAVDNANIQIHRGDIFGLVGRNGAGKTTLMRMISGLAVPSNGAYTYYDANGKILKPEQVQISTLIENCGIYPNLTALDHLKLKGKALGVEDKNFASELLHMLALSNVRKKPVKSFSMGMKQRLGIALALVGKPEFLVLDEPINGLDPQGIAEIRKLITFLNQEHAITFMLSSHLLGELSRVSNRFAIIEEGRVLEVLNREDFDSLESDKIVLVTPDADKAIHVIQQLGYANLERISEKQINILGNGKDTGPIVLALAQAHVPIEEFTVHKNTLEDYYLDLVSGKKEVTHA